MMALLRNGGKKHINNEGLDDGPYVESTTKNVVDYLRISNYRIPNNVVVSMCGGTSVKPHFTFTEKYDIL